MEPCVLDGLALQAEAEQKLDLGSIDATLDSVEKYLHSVGDSSPVYNEVGIAPPLFSAASALGSLLRELALPPGAIHSLQEIETVTPVVIGSEVTAQALVEKPRRRAGLEFVTVVCTVESHGSTAIKSKSTVLVPGEVSSETPSKDGKNQNSGRIVSDLAVVSRSINRERLNAYARSSGDDNPLHLDPDFAAETQFGGIIAHGMLTLAFISEMMAVSHGVDWLQTGNLRVRFKGAAYLGDQVKTWGTLTKDQDSTLIYGVGANNTATGQELITGSAGLTIVRE